MAVNEKTGRAMGVLILNSNAMEYGFLPPQVFSYRTLGGIDSATKKFNLDFIFIFTKGLLDVYIMEEETPEILIKAYTLLIGKPYLVSFEFFKMLL